MKNVNSKAVSTVDFQFSASDKTVVVIENGHRTMLVKEGFVSSLDIAQFFGKDHKDILKKIRAKAHLFTERKIAPSSYVNKQGKNQPMYNLNQDAFVFICMGFTGEQADNIKLAYIRAFNLYRDSLVQIASGEVPQEDIVDLAKQALNVKLGRSAQLYSKGKRGGYALAGAIRDGIENPSALISMLDEVANLLSSGTTNENRHSFWESVKGMVNDIRDEYRRGSNSFNSTLYADMERVMHHCEQRKHRLLSVKINTLNKAQA